RRPEPLFHNGHDSIGSLGEFLSFGFVAAHKLNSSARSIDYVVIRHQERGNLKTNGRKLAIQQGLHCPAHLPIKIHANSTTKVGSERPSFVAYKKCSFISASRSRAFHRPTTSNTLLPSDRFPTSVAIGYHATYPTPRTAVKSLPT